jgi:hypothetical protein
MQIARTGDHEPGNLGRLKIAAGRPPGLLRTKSIAERVVAASIGAAPHWSYSETAWASGDGRTGASFRANSASPTSSTLAGRAPPTRNRRSYSSG